MVTRIWVCIKASHVWYSYIYHNYRLSQPLNPFFISFIMRCLGWLQCSQRFFSHLYQETKNQPSTTLAFEWNISNHLVVNAADYWFSPAFQFIMRKLIRTKGRSYSGLEEGATFRDRNERILSTSIRNNRTGTASIKLCMVRYRIRLSRWPFTKQSTFRNR